MLELSLEFLMSMTTMRKVKVSRCSAIIFQIFLSIGLHSNLSPTYAMLKLYGHYGSQPFRSVAWLLKMKKERFEFISVNPMKGENRTKDYRAKFPVGLIPAIEDDPGDGKTIALSEASAIMIYLCDKNKWNDMYPSSINNPSDIRQRALINEYISHHTESTRLMTQNVIRPGFKELFAAKGNFSSGMTKHALSKSPDDLLKLKSTIRDIAKRFQHKFLVNSRESSNFIVGDHPTIADLLAYPDLAQIPQILGIDYCEWPELEELRQWLDRMAKLPYHDDVHRTTMKLGKLYQSKL